MRFPRLPANASREDASTCLRHLFRPFALRQARTLLRALRVFAWFPPRHESAQFRDRATCLRGFQCSPTSHPPPAFLSLPTSCSLGHPHVFTVLSTHHDQNTPNIL